MTTTAPMTPVERRAWAAVIVAAGVLGVGGFVISFARVSEAMRPYFGDLAPAVPLLVDLGIGVFTALDLLMAYRSIRSRWLRLVPWALVGVTIYLNVVGEPAVEGKVAHAVLPGLWVVAVEVAGAAARAVFGLAEDRPTTLDRVRRSRWVLAPWSTARLRRRMILWEVHSYRDALAREHDRLLARTDLQERYGSWKWRWKAPRRERVLYRLAELAPVESPAPAPQVDDDAEPAEADTTSLDQMAAHGPPEPAQLPPVRPGPTLPAELVAAAEEVADELARAGVTPSRRTIGPPLRERGHTAGTARLDRLVDHLRARAAAQSNGTSGPGQAGPAAADVPA